MQNRILNDDCRVVMRSMPESSVDAVVTDPPYGLSFMGKEWDHGVPGVEFWVEALRVAKPGAHLLAFGGTRTFHRLTCAIEDAGWEIRDCVMWVYGSGFPKSLDVSKAIDKAAGAERTLRVNERWADRYPNGPGGHLKSGDADQQYGQLKRITEGPLLTSEPVTDAARQWSGWGTALKPAWEPIIVARKPLAGTVVANVQEFGAGALNIDGCRVGEPDPTLGRNNKVGDNGWKNSSGGKNNALLRQEAGLPAQGRWPANLIHDGSDEVVGLFPADGDKSAARFFYCAKASKRDRELGLSDDAPIIAAAEMVDRTAGSDGMKSPRAGAGRTTGSKNGHPTVKPTALMRYLCKLVTPPGGTVLDPFCGSGSTGVAAVLEGFAFVGIDADPQWAEVARARCNGISPGSTS